MLSEMLSATEGNRLGTLRSHGLKPLVVRGHAVVFNYWLNAFGHTGPYSQSVDVSIDGSQKVLSKGNPMN